MSSRYLIKLNTLKSRFFVLLASLFLIVSLTAFSNGVVIKINKSTIDGGGGVSIGGNFKMTGTIGQVDSGILKGSNYRLQGGFWYAPPLPEELFSDGFEN